jgi:hypothetical protein
MNATLVNYVSSARAHCFQPVTVSFRDRAKVLWVNQSEKKNIAACLGLPESSDTEKAILENFAYTICEDASKGGDEAVFHADYYGSSGVTYFGGSGRAACTRGAQVKGVGKTPLISDYTNWFHSHGCVFLSEALREVVYSKIIGHKSPHGAVPYWAIIDCNEEIELPGGGIERRALLVRPFVLRPAHIERALGFGHPKGAFARSFHTADIERIKTWIPIAFPDGQASLENLARNLAEQCAYCHLNHWYHGGWFSSVTDIHGRLMDFGSTRQIDSWLRQNFEPGEPPFGSERDYCINTLRSIGFSLECYGGRHGIDMGSVIGVFKASYADYLENNIVSPLKNGLPKNCISDKFLAAFALAQRSFRRSDALKYERDFFSNLSVAPPRALLKNLSREVVDNDAKLLVSKLEPFRSQSAVDSMIDGYLREIVGELS